MSEIIIECPSSDNLGYSKGCIILIYKLLTVSLLTYQITLVLTFFRAPQSTWTRNQSSGSDSLRPNFTYHRSVSEIAPSNSDSGTRKGGFGLPRSLSVPANDDFVNTPTTECESWDGDIKSSRKAVSDNQPKNVSVVVKPPLWFVPFKVKSTTRPRSCSLSSEANKVFDKPLLVSVDIDTKCDAHVQPGMISPGLKLFTNATKQLVNERSRGGFRQPSLDSMNKSGNPQQVNGMLHRDLEESAPIRDFRQRHSSYSSSMSESCESKGSDDGRRRRFHSSNERAYQSENTANDNLPSQCPW